MAGRKVFNEQDARRCLAAVKSSRVDLGTWARAHRVEVVVATATQSGRAPFVLRIGSVELEVGASFDEGALRRLVGLLKSC